VLHKTLKAYNLDEPLIRYVCTLDLSINHVKDISRHGLPELCEHFNIPLIPHDAGSDSCACAELLLHFIKSDVDLEKASNIYSPKKEQFSSNTVSHAQEVKIDKWLCDKILSSGAIKFRDVTGKNICLTGNFEICSKDIIKYFLESRGAIIKTSVSKKVDYLIIGECGSENYIDGTRGTKEIKAIELQQNGCKIEIIREKDFFIFEENTK
jgi:DNA polymerase-3 subunit epsilon